MSRYERRVRSRILGFNFLNGHSTGDNYPGNQFVEIDPGSIRFGVFAVVFTIDRYSLSLDAQIAGPAMFVLGGSFSAQCTIGAEKPKF
jgi:hypothetical protein